MEEERPSALRREETWRELNREGIAVARCTVERLMGELGIAGVAARRKRPRTTVPALLAKSARLTCWSATLPPRAEPPVGRGHYYVETVTGFVYAAFILGLFSRMIVGWQVSDTFRAELALDALEMAIWSRGGRMNGPLVHHSDRGVQYTSIRYAERIGEISAVRSVGRKGDSYDNAAAESLNSLYKKGAHRLGRAVARSQRCHARYPRMGRLV